MNKLNIYTKLTRVEVGEVDSCSCCWWRPFVCLFWLGEVFQQTLQVSFIFFKYFVDCLRRPSHSGFDWRLSSMDVRKKQLWTAWPWRYDKQVTYHNRRFCLYFIP